MLTKIRKAMSTVSGAAISDCELHRYSLWRKWDSTKPVIMFIGLNPSRADAVKNDPTITRCVGFARRWGYGGLYFANLFSFKTPKPKVLVANLDKAVGPDCDYYLRSMISESEKVVCCWGSWSFIEERSNYVRSLISEPWCFGKNQGGQPKHPLYLKSTSELIKLNN